MEDRFGNLRYRTRAVTGIAGPSKKVKAGRYVVYDPVTRKETTANSADVFATALIGDGPAVEERCWDALHPGPPFHSGGVFDHIRIERPNFDIKEGGEWELGVYQPRPTLNQKYIGGFYNPLWVPSVDTTIGSAIQQFAPGVSSTQFNPSDLSSRANVAYNKLRPKVEVASLAQTIAEARDIPSMLRTTGKGFAKSWRAISSTYKSVRNIKNAVEMAPKEASNQFLNTIFGWKPFVKDVQDICNILVNGHEIIEQKMHNNDRWNPVHFYEDEVKSETIVYSRSDICGCQPADNSSFGRVVGPVKSYTITRETIERVWYKGSFKYYYPEFDSKSWSAGYPALQTVRQYLRISGIKIDPVLLYKIYPWTWMVDWFTDVGDSIQRLQDLATDATVSRYFYVMRERTFRYRMRSQFTTTHGSHDLSWYYGGTSQTRSDQSSEFGFNLKPINLSGVQLAILAALGLSKGGSISGRGL